MEDIDILVNFVAGNSNKLQKLGLEGKISWALSICSHCWINKKFNSENVKIKNVFTLGLMAQATLVEVKGTKHDHRLAKLYVGFYGN